VRLPLSWLREHVALPPSLTAREIAAGLVRLGVEVEEIGEVGADLVGPVLVGRVLEFEEFTASDGKTIRWCQVDVGEAQPRGIVCGAGNFLVDDLVVVCLPGDVIPGDGEVIDGVAETLEYLAGRHDLTLFTKGHVDEQRLKVDRSGLGRFFQHTAIVKEKDTSAYRRLVVDRGMDPAATWMIGNSPKSDVNPALEAGLNAVFVPHAHTWVLEKQDIVPGAGQLLIVEKFGDLRERF